MILVQIQEHKVVVVVGTERFEYVQGQPFT